mgnify:CR=1 FL=1
MKKAYPNPHPAQVYAASVSKTPLLMMLKQSVMTGLYFYTYNEIAMLALNQVPA